MKEKTPQFVDQITQLFMLSMEGTITEKQYLELTKILKESAISREYYYDFIALHVGASEMGILSEIGDAEGNWLGQQIWDAFLKEEKNAPAIEMPKEEPELIQKVVRQKTSYKVNKFSLYSAIVGVAAMLFIGIFLRFAPDRSSVEVASLTDSIGVTWSNPSLSLANGDRFSSDECFSLSKGVVEVQTDGGVELMIEGPSEFEFTRDADLQLNYGRVYARVSSRGIGFAVNTANSKVIDLGTEFGVQTGVDGKTELHVVKGKTTLVAGSSWLAKKSQTILKDQARCVIADGAEIKDIPIRKEAFVRSVHSETNSLWRGQDYINLSDIVGGGNGLGTGVIGAGIDSISGDSVSQHDVSHYSMGSRDYIAVNDNPFVDGVFVPDGEHGPVQISSKGHSFKDCPDTDGTFWVGVQSGGQHYVRNEIKKHSLSLVGVPYGTSEKSSIFMHVNQGITFDLENIRQSVPDAKITRFTASCGLSDSIFNSSTYTNGNSQWTRSQKGLPAGDFWVLVDGQLRFSKIKQLPVDTPASINIPISDSDRFLTIIATDSDRLTSFVWSLFAEPRLHLENCDE